MNKKNKISIRSVLIIIFLMIIFYSLISIYSGIDDISENFKSMNFLYVMPIIVVVLTSILFRSWIQKLLLEQIEVKLPLKDNFLLFLSGLALIISPGGTGQVIKSYFLKEKYDISVSKSIPVILFERYYDLISVTALVIISVCIIFSLEALVVSMLALIIIFIVSIALRKESLFTKFLSLRKKIMFMKQLEINEKELYLSIKLLNNHSLVCKIAVLTILVTFWDGIAIYMGFLSFGMDIGYFEATQFYYTSLILGVMSLIPGGMGVLEGGFTILSSKYLEMALAVSIIIFIRLTTIWFTTFLGMIVAFRTLFRHKISF